MKAEKKSMERFLQNLESDLANKNNINVISVLNDFLDAVLENYSDLVKKFEKLKSIDVAESESEEEKSKSTHFESQATENAQTRELIRTLRRELITAWKSNDELRKELSELRSQFEIVSSRLEAENRLRLDNQNLSLRSRFEALGIKFEPTVNLDTTTDQEPVLLLNKPKADATPLNSELMNQSNK